MSNNVRTWGYEYTETLLRLKRERDQWRECAELFVNSLCRPKGDNPTAKAFAEFDRLKGETK